MDFGKIAGNPKGSAMFINQRKADQYNNIFLIPGKNTGVKWIISLKISLPLLQKY
ncbi:MAG: hypothetical protein ACI8X3_003549 [Saprospiraceae bacterium]|jgi:hypothetical protein